MSNMIEYDLRGADPRSVDELKAALEGCMNDWPGIAPRKVECVSLPPEVLGSTNNRTMSGFAPGESVEVNEDAMSNYADWQQSLRSYVVQGISSTNQLAQAWVVQHPAAYTIEHEFGHVLFGHLYGEGCSPTGERAAREFMNLAWRATDAPETDHGEVPNMLVPLGFALGIGREEIIRDLSIYAASSPMELVAEAFAVERVLGRGKSKIADAVTDKLREDYEAKFGSRK